jgi:hypothetical protein
MITLHFDHANMEIPSEMLIEIAEKFKVEKFGLFVEFIHTIADNIVRKIYGNIPAYPVWEFKTYNTIKIDVFAVGQPALRIELNNGGVFDRLSDDWVKLSAEEIKGLLRFFYRHEQHEQITRLIELPSNDDGDTPF